MTADLVDAMGRLHRHRCHLLDLVSPTPGRVLFGPAVTISYFPGCSAGLDPDKYNLANLFYEAVGDEPEGKVVVLASNGYTDASMGGGTKLSRLQHHGCAGVLTAACATLTSSPPTTSLPTALARRRSGEAMR
jgi:4-hydroxy-4-methyl-2-oxoglutarate aldolase